MELPGAGILARISNRRYARKFEDPEVQKCIMHYSDISDHTRWFIREISTELSKDLDGPDQIIVHTLLNGLDDPLSDGDDVEVIVKHLVNKLKKRE